MVTDAPSDEHPNVRRARFEALARDELVEPLWRRLTGRTDPGTAENVLAETLLACWHRFDEAPDPALPWAIGIADGVLGARGSAVSGRVDAPDVSPPDLTWVTHVLADVVGEQTDTESRRTGTRGRSSLTWLVAAVALVLIAVAAAYVVLRQPGPAPMPGVDGAPEVVTVSLPDRSGAQRCMVPTADVLGRADLAFDGEVTGVSGSSATLAPSRVFRGGPADEVRVAQATASRVSLILGVRFEEGERYLVAAEDGRVMVCGFSARYDARLASLYERAFAGPE